MAVVGSLHRFFADISSSLEEQCLMRGHLAKYNIRYGRLPTSAELKISFKLLIRESFTPTALSP